MKPPERLWVQLTPNGGTISHILDPREVHDNGKPVYVYVLVSGDDEAEARAIAERVVEVIAGVPFDCPSIEAEFKEAAKAVNIDKLRDSIATALARRSPKAEKE